MKHYFAIILFFFNAVAFSQNDSVAITAKIDSLKKLRTDTLIKLAVKKLNESGFNPATYDRIKIKTTPKSLVVNFGISVRFTSNRACYYNTVFVALVGSGTGKGIMGDCNEPKFYKLSAAQKKKINYVFDAINKSNNIGRIKNINYPKAQLCKLPKS